MHKDAFRVQRIVNQAWENAIRGMKQINQASDVLPRTPCDVFNLDSTAPNEVVKLNIGPVIFYVPERASHRPNLYIVIRGWLIFEGPDFKNKPLKTKEFGTEVAYFRSKPGALEHVYGVHYDMDEIKSGHPVFHAQFNSQLDFGEAVKQRFNLNDELKNCIGTILGTVRIPSAQMDIFSVITQICADHLIGQNSSQEVKCAFRKMREECDFLIGAAHRMPFLNQLPATSCFRSTHWYLSPVANQ